MLLILKPEKLKQNWDLSGFIEDLETFFLLSVYISNCYLFYYIPHKLIYLLQRNFISCISYTEVKLIWLSFSMSKLLFV